MKKSRILGFFSSLLAGTVNVGGKRGKKLNAGEGFVEIKGGKVWYRIVGEGDQTPIILLHGGPGAPSHYLNPLAALSRNRSVIFYDQLGCGRSDRTIAAAQMTLDYFVAELEQLREALGLNEFYLYGHSWGSMLALDYYLAHPGCVKALILGSPAISIPLWVEDTKALIATLPDFIQQAIWNSVTNNTFDTLEYQRAITVYMQNFLARKLPWSADIENTFAQVNEEVYGVMWGPNEFCPTGKLKDYDRTSQLQKLRIPTLFITGEFDEARPETVKHYQSLVPGARLAVTKNAAHITMQDNPEEDIRAILEFLNGLEVQGNRE